MGGPTVIIADRPRETMVVSSSSLFSMKSFVVRKKWEIITSNPFCTSDSCGCVTQVLQSGLTSVARSISTGSTTNPAASATSSRILICMWLSNAQTLMTSLGLGHSHWTSLRTLGQVIAAPVGKKVCGRLCLRLSPCNRRQQRAGRDDIALHLGTTFHVSGK